MEVSFCLLDVDYFIENEKPIIRIHGKTKDSHITILDTNFLPYLYVLPNGEIDHLKNLILNSFNQIPIKKIEQVKKKYLGKEVDLLKVSILYPADMRDLKEELTGWKSVKKVFEHDIHFYKRYMIDKNIYPFKWYKAECEEGNLKSIEETNNENLSPIVISIEIEKNGNTISSISIDGKNPKTFLGEEKTIIEDLIHEIREQDPDIICGYSTDSFIFPELFEAAKRNSIPFEIGRFPGEPFIKKTGRITAYYLKGRTHIDLSHMGIIIGSIEKTSTIKDFHIFFPKIIELSLISGQTAFDATRMDHYKILEWLMIRKAIKNNEIIPNKPVFEEAERRRNSGYKKEIFIEAKEGLYENICKSDIRKIYSNIIVNHNISPETLNCDCCKNGLVSSDLAFIENRVPNEQYYFCTHHIGFFPKIIKHMLSQEKNEILETISKSLHSYFNNPWSRWYSGVCSKSIISWGKEYLTSIFGSEWNNLIYADPEIIFGRSNILEKIESDIEKSFFKRGFIFPSKASPKYILLDSNNKTTEKGFEKNKSDWAKITRETHKKILDLILKECNIEKAIELFDNTTKEIEKGNLPLENFVMETKLAKSINEYEKIDPHISAAKKALENGIKIEKGSIIKYIITKEGKSISDKSEIINLAKNYDPEYYNNQLKSACSKLFYLSNLNENNLDKQSLSKFMEK